MLTKKEKIVLEVLKKIIKKKAQLSGSIVIKELSKSGLVLKSHNSLTQYYRQLKLKGYIKIIPYRVTIL